jgi:hypothetical protein
VDAVEIKASIDTTIHEFGDFAYHLQRHKTDPDVLVLSLKLSMPLAEGAEQDIRETYSNIAKMQEHPEEGYTVTLQVNLHCTLLV